MPNVTNPVRVSLISASVGIALIAVLATYLRRKRRRRPTTRDARRDRSREVSARGDSLQHSNFSRSKRGRSPTTANGDILHRSQNGVKSQSSHLSSHGGSTSSINTTDSKLSTTTLTEVQDTSKLNAEQLCDLGMEALQTAINHWEDALEKLEENDKSDHIVINASLQGQLQQLLHRAYNIQDHYEQKLLGQVNANVAMDSAMSALKEMDRAYDETRRSRTASVQDDLSSDQDSFVSATDMADLSDLEDQKDAHPHLVLYEAAILELTHGNVPCRSLRTKMLNCLSDTEFLSKLFCVRLAFAEVFKDATLQNFFADSGRQMLADLLIQADRDPEDFQVAYDQMIDFISCGENWADIDIELRGRGVKALNFFDIVIDFILFDAFDDLECPPSSVTSVVQNRWLSNGFKETALSTAVWSVLKAKRRMLKFPKGFIAHFYAISEHTSPVLAWGFLGPEGHLKDLCNYFKDQVLGLMRDIFSFDKVRYTTIEHLTADIVRLARKRIAATSAKLSSFS